MIACLEIAYVAFLILAAAWAVMTFLFLTLDELL